MDPNTVIVVLAAHLIFTGGLLHLIGRRMPPRCGLHPWSIGLVLFGCAYIARITLGFAVPLPVALLTDATMLGAGMFFVVGLREFVGRQALDLRVTLSALALFVVVDGLAITTVGAVGRHATLNLGLGLVYAWLAWSSASTRRTADRLLGTPLLMLATMMGLLSALTIARGLYIANAGVGVAYQGRFAQGYYGYASLSAVLLAMTLLWMVFVRLNGQLAELATRDALTKVLNRAGLDDALRRHFGSRQALPLVLLAVDVDRFKAINDGHGHAAGDRVLRTVADTLARHVRPNDLVARVGGEEFLVCCPAAEREVALALAERLRATVAAQTTPAGTVGLRCTVSIGVAWPCMSLASVADAAAEADRALYRAKEAGRDRVMAAA